jgi:anti-sigma B factor antagonist
LWNNSEVGLAIEQREREGIVILDVKGRITVGAEATVMRERLRAQAAAGSLNFILNLREVDYIDSTGLGAMVVCFTSVRKLGGKLKLEHLNRRNIELLVLTKLTTVFEIFSDEQDAINSFFPGREIKRFDILSFVKEQASGE